MVNEIYKMPLQEVISVDSRLLIVDCRSLGDSLRTVFIRGMLETTTAADTPDAEREESRKNKRNHNFCCTPPFQNYLGD
jgi:hypothetical protein